MVLYIKKVEGQKKNKREFNERGCPGVGLLV